MHRPSQLPLKGATFDNDRVVPLHTNHRFLAYRTKEQKSRAGINKTGQDTLADKEKEASSNPKSTACRRWTVKMTDAQLVSFQIFGMPVLSETDSDDEQPSRRFGIKFLVKTHTTQTWTGHSCRKGQGNLFQSRSHLV